MRDAAIKMVSPEPGLSLQEAAVVTGLAPLTLRKVAVDAGKVAFYRVARRLVFRVSDLEAFMLRCRVPAREEAR